jgi:hypothetical protein
MNSNIDVMIGQACIEMDLMHLVELFILPLFFTQLVKKLNQPKEHK